MSDIKRTQEWFVKAGQMPATPLPDVRQSAFYLGMQVEELTEKLLASGVLAQMTSSLEGLLNELGTFLKDGRLDDAVSGAFADGQADAMLDADMDILWVTIGAATAQGADPVGAYAAVGDANWAKFPGGVVTRHPATGKVVKPEGWRPPVLTDFLHPALRTTA